MRRWWMFFSAMAVLTLWVAGPALAADAEYVGYQKCKGCHSYQYKVWKDQKHAKASEVLPAEKKEDPTCLKCHSTGAEKGASLEGVQCEACHGPGSLYKSPKIMSRSKFKQDAEGQLKLAVEAGLVLPTEEVCQKCHTSERPEGHAPAKPFSFEEAKKQIDHSKK